MWNRIILHSLEGDKFLLELVAFAFHIQGALIFTTKTKQFELDSLRTQNAS